MNRSGFGCGEAEHAIAQLDAGGIEAIGLMSHLAYADVLADPLTVEQYGRFRKRVIAGKHISVSNSEGILRGMIPVASASEISLKPVMNLTSKPGPYARRA
ncbi:hypothetical protein WJ58_09885 [Burkholderia ubonensis]|nr:hypothetical protein WJ58_09885 [Burkholderia ubonensis]